MMQNSDSDALPPDLDRHTVIPRVLFEDNHCLAVAKPAPLLTQGVPRAAPGGPIPTLEALVKDYLKERYHKAGNVYLGKVQNVLPSMEAAFVDIGRGRNAQAGSRFSS